MQPKFHRIRDPETLGKRIVFLLTQPDHRSHNYRKNVSQLILVTIPYLDTGR